MAVRATGSIEMTEIFQQKQSCATDNDHGNKDWNSHENYLSQSLFRGKPGIFVVKVSHVVGIKCFFLRQLHASFSNA
jgi:hypothetical protein